MSTYNTIFIAISFFFTIFSIHLFFTNKNTRQLTRFLSIIIFARVGQIILFYLVKNNNLAFFPLLYSLFYPLYYLTPACLFLYVKTFLSGEKVLRKKDWIHFVPFIIAIIHFLPFNLFTSVNWEVVAERILDNKQIFMSERTGVFPVIFFSSLRITLIVGYLIASWWVLIKSSLFKGPKWTLNKIWLVFILALATFFNTISFLPFFISSKEINSLPWFMLLNCLGMLFIMLYLLHRPNLLYGYLLVNVGLEKKTKSSQTKTKTVEKTNNSNHILTETQFNKEELEALMLSKKLFLDCNFQVLDLAKELGISVHQCSNIVNNIVGKNFRDWINYHRVLFFLEVYPIRKKQITISAIAYESGFKSLTTFYAAFKKETGMMPKQYFSKEKELVE